MSDDFDSAFRAATHSRKYAPRLRTLLGEVFVALNHRPADLPKIRASLDSLFDYLSSPEGRTDANCSVTDYFFSGAESWPATWKELPPDYQRVLDDLGGTLHDTVFATNIARTFETLPEQLLQRIRAPGE